MGDLFDEFMRDLRRRQAAGGDDGPREPRAVGPDDPEGDGPDDDDPGDADRPRPIRRATSGGGRRRGQDRTGSGGSRRYFALPIAIAALVILGLVGGALAELITELMWYGSVGYEGVFLTGLGAQVG